LLGSTDVAVLEDEIESVTCRWCGPAGEVQEIDPADEAVENPSGDS